jgi:hypothetical protein
MELGLLALDHHHTTDFVSTTYMQAPELFAKMVVDTMVAYNDASGGEFDHTPMTISFYTHRRSVMLVGRITEDLYTRVRQRVHFMIRRRTYENGFD